MIEIVRTNDVALISVLEGLLQEEDIPCFVPTGTRACSTGR